MLQVVEKEQAVTLRCDPISAHETLIWYQYAAGKEMTFLIRFLREYIQDESGLPGDRFLAERTEGTFSTLKVRAARPEDSGVYFCASSPNTVLQSQARTPPPQRRGALNRREEEPELTLEMQEY